MKFLPITKKEEWFWKYKRSLYPEELIDYCHRDDTKEQGGRCKYKGKTYVHFKLHALRHRFGK